MSTYFTDMPLVYLFHGILSFFLAHYIYVGTSNRFMSAYFTINYFNFLSNCFMSSYFTDWSHDSRALKVEKYQVMYHVKMHAIISNLKCYVVSLLRLG